MNPDKNENYKYYNGYGLKGAVIQEPFVCLHVIDFSKGKACSEYTPNHHVEKAMHAAVEPSCNDGDGVEPGGDL